MWYCGSFRYCGSKKIDLRKIFLVMVLKNICLVETVVT
jgi:hypothetical protein